MTGIQIYVTGLDSSILLTMFQLLKLHLVDKRVKSEFGRKKTHKKTGLELSTRIRKQNVVPIFLGFEIILLALDGRRGIWAGIPLVIRNSYRKYLVQGFIHSRSTKNVLKN